MRAQGTEGTFPTAEVFRATGNFSFKRQSRSCFPAPGPQERFPLAHGSNEHKSCALGPILAQQQKDEKQEHKLLLFPEQQTEFLGHVHSSRKCAMPGTSGSVVVAFLACDGRKRRSAIKCTLC